MDETEVLAQIDRAIEMAGDAVDASEAGWRESGQYSEAITVCASTITRLTAIGSVYERQSRRILDRQGSSLPFYAEQLQGILKALRLDVVDGYLRTVQQEAHAEVFADLLQMADHLVADRHHLPAAVIAGAALEAHLRALAERSGVSVSWRNAPKRAGRLNDDLAKAGAYTKAEHKQIIAWQDLRNVAAHADGELAAAEVRLMAQGIRAFIDRHPA